MATCCGAVFTLTLVDRKAGDSTILHTLHRRRCGKKIFRYFKIVFSGNSYYAPPDEGDIGLMHVFGLCKNCAKKSPSIFTDRYKIPQTVLDNDELCRSFNTRVNRIDTRLAFGLSGRVISVEECDAETDTLLNKQKQYNRVKHALKAIISEMEQTMHISDPETWKHIFNEVVDDLIIEGVMDG